MSNDLISIESLFYLAGTVAVISSLKVVTGKNTIHALLYLVVSLLAVAVCFYLMGAPFAAGLEIIVYAGAILVLFVFAITMFGLSKDETKHAPKHRGYGVWVGPIFLASCLLIELLFVIDNAEIQQNITAHIVSSKQVGMLLYGPYLLAVEIASFLLLAGLLSGYHYAKSETQGGHL